MFYVLFTYSKGRKERDFRKFRSEDDLINFLHENYESIDIVQILGAERIYKLGLIETEELAKSALFEKKIETDLPDPEKKSFMEEIIDETEKKEALKIPDEAILEPGEKDDRSSKKHPFLKDRKEEPSAMEKIADDIEEEMTDEEIIKKNKELLKKADGAMAAAEKDLAKTNTKLIINPAEKPEKRHYTQNEDRKKDWATCPECKKNPMAPWNTSGRCSECQQYKKIPKKLKLDKTGWQTCPKCDTRKVAPWSKTGICSYCQGNRGKKKK